MVTQETVMELLLDFPDADPAELARVTVQLEKLGVLNSVDRRQPSLGTPGVTEIIVALGVAGVFKAVASIIVSYLNHNKGKEVRTVRPDGATWSISGYSVAEIERLFMLLSKDELNVSKREEDRER